MNRLLFTLVFLIISVTVISQIPKAFKYQAIIRDSSGSVISDRDISLKISLLEGRIYGEEIYSEIHQQTTNNYGLISLDIGNGSNQTGDFDNIMWGDSSYYMKTELDELGGNNFQVMGITQILSVPIAFYAETTGDTTRWRKDSTHIYYRKGNVGIGTNNPLNLLHLSRECIHDTDNVGLNFSNPYSNGNSWFLGIKSMFDPAGFSIISDSSSTAPSMFISKSGKIGIGKYEPEHDLDVEGSIYTRQGIHFYDSTSITSAQGFWGASDNCVFREEGNVVIGNSNCSQYKLAINPDENGMGLAINGITEINEQGALNIIHPGGSVRQMGYFNTIEEEPCGYGMHIFHQAEVDTITKWAGIYVDYAYPDSTRYAAVFKNGNVGIGTDNPIHNLHVEGSSLINGKLGINKINPQYSLDIGGNIRVQDSIIGDSSSADVKFNIIGSKHVNAAKIELGKGANQASTIKLVSREYGSIQFFTDSKIRMQIRDSVVVIGRPIEDRYVDLQVNGKIHTKEVEVYLDNWWDNVFDNDYDLPSLDEVEAYIEENNHLPGIPSEKAILDEGVNLGEMNGLLLKKIEELTLYLLELNKENKQLAIEVEKLKDRR